jgi:hypothetical protein
MKKVFPFYVLTVSSQKDGRCGVKHPTPHFIEKILITILLISLLVMMGSQSNSVHAQDGESPTPTYDPLKEPFVPDNPTDYELGQNWYWHYCMPCHGDKGQGLTDEWRAVWEPDHQDCWGKGCHAGERIEDSFVIPTVVPPVVSSVKLARFSSVHTLYEYLKTTHPPQNPGWLEDKQYRAIALYIFSENDRPLVESTLTLTITPIYTGTPLPEAVPVKEYSQNPNMILYLGLGVMLVVMVIWGIRKLR